MKALARLCGCAGLPEPLLIAFVINISFCLSVTKLNCYFAYLLHQLKLNMNGINNNIQKERLNDREIDSSL